VTIPNNSEYPNPVLGSVDSHPQEVRIQFVEKAIKNEAATIMTELATKIKTIFQILILLKKCRNLASKPFGTSSLYSFISSATSVLLFLTITHKLNA
jgi:hypothetical protein